MDTTRMMFALLSLCLVLFCSSPVSAISPISVKGTKLYDNDGNQFFVKGVAYVPGAGRSDPLADAKQCKTDAAMINKLGANTIYVYSVDTRNDHDGCMQEFANQGIYVWLQLGDFPRSTDTTETGPQWTQSVFNGWTEVLEAFAGYDNVLALGIGQETITESSNSTLAAPSLKAAARDLRAFRSAQGYRAIPLSYSIADVDQLRLATAQYLSCGTNPLETIDLIGLNIFLKCTDTDWQSLAAQFRALPVPVVISESGCRSDPESARNFTEVALVLGGGLFTEVFSGISIYEWAMQKQPRYGVVNYSNEARTGVPAALPQFTSLSGVFASAKATGTAAGLYTPVSGSALACPTKDVAAGWLVEGNALLPTISGLVIGAVSVTQTARSTATGAAGSGGGGQDDGGQSGSSESLGAHASDTGGGLAKGAIAGIVLGIVCLLFVALGVFVCLRRRRAASMVQHEVHSNSDEPPPSYQYHYPAGKVELPTHNMAAVEMDGAPSSATRSASSARPLWKLPIQGGGRDDSPTVAAAPELPDRRWWRRTRHFELEDTAHTVAGAGTTAGTNTGSWQVSPLSPGSKYV